MRVTINFFAYEISGYASSPIRMSGKDSVTLGYWRAFKIIIGEKKTLTVNLASE